MKKAKSILSNTIKSVIAPVFQMILAFFVLQNASSEVWGDFVERVILIGIIIQVINWGHKEYLLRSFSENPSAIKQSFSRITLTRAILLVLPILFFVSLASDPKELLLLISWLVIAFAYQSFDVLVIYKKAFLRQILIETAGFTVTIAGLYFAEQWVFTYPTILKWYVIGLIPKLILIQLFEHNETVWPTKPVVEYSFFKKSLPFLLIGLSGMLVTKADLYIIGIFGTAEELGNYQILITLFIYLQALGSFIATPYLRHMYRISKHSFESITRKFYFIGFGVTILAIPFVYGIIHYIYGLEFPYEVYLLGFLSVIPVYLYLPVITKIFKAHLEKRVMYINFGGALLNAILTILLYEHFQLIGALIAVAIMQWTLAIYYRFQNHAVDRFLDQQTSNHSKK